MDDDLKTSEDCLSSVVSMTPNHQDISHVKTLDDFKTRIGAAWHRSFEGVIETGLLWAQAKKELNRDQLVELRDTTKFSDPTISKLISIAEDTRITDPRYRAIMPSSYGTLYELKRLSEAEFEAAVNDGLLRPDIEREEVMALRGGQHSGRAKAKAKGTVLVTILLSKDEIDDADLRLLKSVVSSLLECPSVTVEPSPPWKRLAKCLPTHQGDPLWAKENR